MKAIVINVAQAKDRMAMMARQLDLLGLDWSRLEAVTPADIDPDRNSPIWKAWQRPLRDTEIAAFLSHWQAWKQVDTEPVLVLEDDVVLSVGCAAVLDKLQERTGIDHLSLETRGRKKLLERQAGSVWPMRQDRTGAAAYVLWPSGARELLRRSDSIRAIADAQISETRMNSFQAVPAQAIQLDICEAYGITPPIATKSLIDKAEKPPVPKGQGYRRRRIFGQIAMGLNQVSHPRAQRVHVQPDPGIAEMAGWLISKTD